MKAFPLDMSQYDRLFSTTRIPCKDKDELMSYEPNSHIVVIRNGNFYTLDAAQPDGESMCCTCAALHLCSRDACIHLEWHM